ncbi:MAG TPA: porin [Bacteroidota bacterium]|nr:porin [Bacteroidota bacterium]
MSARFSAKRCLLLFVVGLAPLSVVAQEQPKTTVSGFVDVYYCYDFSRPLSRDRSFTTQPMRHNEFTLNLGMIDVKYQAVNIRGRFAFQTGTYVQSNLAAEPSLLKNVLEASVGSQIGTNIWADLGIFPSHIGFEGIVSKDNWNYSRSLLADYSPYYESGISVTVSLSDQLTLRGLLLNGWQNIAETNDSKAFGTQIQYKPSGSLLANWSTFAGNEQPDTSSSRLRFFNDFFAVVTLSDSWSLAVVFDFGMQKKAAGGSYDSWNTSSIMVKHSIDERWAIGGRVEHFIDKHGSIVPTGTPNNFQTTGASINIDYAPVSNLVWRVEARIFSSKDAVYPARTGLKSADGFLTVSAAVSL